MKFSFFSLCCHLLKFLKEIFVLFSRTISNSFKVCESKEQDQFFEENLNMEYWKFVILTYISVALIEGIPTGNDINDKKCKFFDFILIL